MQVAFKIRANFFCNYYKLVKKVPEATSYKRERYTDVYLLGNCIDYHLKNQNLSLYKLKVWIKSDKLVSPNFSKTLVL